MAGTPARFEVLLTEGAEQDLEAIHDYISNVRLCGQRQLRAGCVSGARQLPEGTGQPRHQGVSPNLLQAIPRDLPCDWQPGHPLPDRGRAS